MRRPFPSLPLRVLLVLALLGGQSPRALARGPQEVAPAVAEEPRVQELRSLLERDPRASFSPHSAEVALASMSGGLDPRQRPIALFALGAAGERAMRPRLESWAVEGTPADRRAAILGLAEGGLAPLELLARLGRSSVPEVRDAALFALARIPGEQAGAKLDQLAAHELGDPAAVERARAFVREPLSTPDFETGRVRLQLRWDAARLYGLIDNQPWRARLLADRTADSEFLDLVIYQAASRLRRTGIADHFLQLALGSGPPSRLRSVVNAIPSELDRMVQAGVWYPSTQEEWAQILHEVDERRMEGLTGELLRRARAFPDLSAHAEVLLVRAGHREGLRMLELDVVSPDPEKRERIAETLGGTREARYVELLEQLASDEVPRVRAAALIAQMRLGHAPSIEAVRGRLSGLSEEPRAELLAGLARLAYVPEIAGLLREYQGECTPEERLLVAIALAREGDVREAAILRDALSESLLRSPQGVHYVQALVRIGANAEVQSLFELFPLEDASAVDVELAVAMCERREHAVLPILRAALWRGPFDRSCLAAALMQHVAGIDSLRLELERPPKGAHPEDVRRVGYALGEWGGTLEVERLARRRTAADPALQGALLGALAARTH